MNTNFIFNKEERTIKVYNDVINGKEITLNNLIKFYSLNTPNVETSTPII